MRRRLRDIQAINLNDFLNIRARQLQRTVSQRVV
jgi:hypothetical protein